jgi:hypothetical protein
MPLIAHYPLQEDSGDTAYDFGTSGNNGTVKNNPTLGSTGLLGSSSYDFSGNNGYIDLGTVLPSGPFSIMAWVDWNSLSQYQRAVTLETNHQAGIRSFGSGSKDSRFFVDNGGGTVQATVDVTGWHHHCGVWDGSTAYYYVDGKPQGTDAASSSGSQSASDTIGSRSNATEPLDGKVADARFYDHAVSQSTVQFLYESVAGQAAFEVAEKTI